MKCAVAFILLTNQSQNQNRLFLQGYPSMPILFLIVFINLVGFGLVIPLMPFYALRLGVGAEIVTLTIAAYSLAQFVTAPITGKLSDKYGRRPILIWTLGGTVISYLILSVADSLSLLMFARVFGGVMAGNIATAYAYATDISTNENRSKSMGMIGAAFGLGFIFGPVMGGWLAGPDVATANYHLPALVSAGLSFAAFLGVIFFLPESLKPEIRDEIAKKPKVRLAKQLHMTFHGEVLAVFVIIGFLFVGSWALFESTFALWANVEFNYGPSRIGTVLSFVGIIGVIVQGGLIGPLTKKFGENHLLLAALAVSVIGYVLLANASALTSLLIALAVLAIGSGLFNPSITSLVSKEAKPSERGFVLGIYQGIGSLARVIGPASAGFIFANFGHNIPFMVGSALMIPSLLLSFFVIRHRRAA